MDNLFGFRGGDPRVVISGVVKPASKTPPTSKQDVLLAWELFQRVLRTLNADERAEVISETSAGLAWEWETESW